MIMDNFYEMYKDYDGIDVDDLIHIPEISWYNHNYYIGLKIKDHTMSDLIFAESDDDNITQYYHVNGSSSTYIGYEFASEGILHITNEKFT